MVEILVIFQDHLESYFRDLFFKLHQHLIKDLFYPTYRVSHTAKLKAVKYLSNCYFQAMVYFKGSVRSHLSPFSVLIPSISFQVVHYMEVTVFIEHREI